MKLKKLQARARGGCRASEKNERGFKWLICGRLREMSKYFVVYRPKNLFIIFILM
jgi:hypothetical protein